MILTGGDINLSGRKTVNLLTFSAPIHYNVDKQGGGNETQIYWKKNENA